jgi:hypothetical protein
LASRIPEETCTSLNLGCADPDSIRLEDWVGREGEGILLVPKAGETPCRLKP